MYIVHPRTTSSFPKNSTQNRGLVANYCQPPQTDAIPDRVQGCLPSVTQPVNGTFSHPRLKKKLCRSQPVMPEKIGIAPLFRCIWEFMWKIFSIIGEITLLTEMLLLFTLVVNLISRKQIVVIWFRSSIPSHSRSTLPLR